MFPCSLKPLGGPHIEVNEVGIGLNFDWTEFSISCTTFSLEIKTADVILIKKRNNLSHQLN